MIYSASPTRAYRLIRSAGIATAAALAVLPAPVAAAPAPPYETLIASIDSIPATFEAEALHEAATARAQQARAVPNPTISIEAENAFGGRPYSGYGAADTTLAISQPLEVFGQRGARISAARAEAIVAGVRRDESRWAVAGRLALIYAEAEAAALQHELAADALSLTQADADAVRVLVKEGREAVLRSVHADSEVEAARAVLDETRANRDGAFARLAAVAALSHPVTSIEVRLLERPPTQVKQTESNSLAVRLAEAELDAAGTGVVVEQLRARPEVTAMLGVRRFEEYNTQALTAGVSISVPLFDRNTGAISAARAEKRAAEARLASSRLEAKADRSAAQASLAASISRTRAADNRVVTAEEAYRLARLGFDSGRISQLELRGMRAALITARYTAVEARLARVRAEVELARLDGRPPFEEA